eukprot:COSAG01_NODE_64656_length_275_cov_15.068182_2_plen_24_part_01
MQWLLMLQTDQQHMSHMPRWMKS